MKHLSLLSLAVLAIAVFDGCNRLTPVSPEETLTLAPGPGMFGFSYKQGLGKKTAALAATRGVNFNFDLGSIKGSTAFYFLLYNVGSRPITNVRLYIANSHFSVFPSSIDTLVPEGDVGMLPVVKVSAFHGTALSGVGYCPLMPMGTNTITLIIEGVTKTRKGVDTSITMRANLSVNALVMNVDFFDSDGMVRFDRSPTMVLAGGFPEGLHEMMRYDIGGCSLVISNTGNVPVFLRAYYTFRTPRNIWLFDDTLTYTCDVGQKTEIPTRNTEIFLSIDGNNTIADPEKFSLYPSGRYYYYLRGDGSPNCIPDFDSILKIDAFKTLVNTESAQCTIEQNRLFLIDSSMVFWDFHGNCSGGSEPIFRLYGKSPSKQLSYYKDGSTAKGGIIIAYSVNQTYQTILDTIRAHLSAVDLGLGASHKVEQIVLN